MVSTLFAKTIRDRWLAMTIATSVLVIFMFYAMAVYRTIDLSIYTDLPRGIRDLMGIPAGADAATLSYNVMLGFVGALTLAGLAISMGSAAIAGEERDGTLSLLLANPKSRTQILVSKTASMMALVAATTAVLWGAGYLIPALLNVDIGATRLGAMMLHLGVNALFYGLVALAIGAWTGNRSLASGVTAGVMILSYFAVGLLPLVDGLRPAAKAFPWYYFAGGEPLLNGIRWDHLAVLSGGGVVAGATAIVGLDRRDLKGASVGITVLDRLRTNPRTRQLFDRLAGSTRVSRLWIKITSEHQGLLVVTSVTMFGLMGVLMGPMYAAIADNVAGLSDEFPEVILALAGGGDMATAEGFFQVETFSLMAPIAVMIVTVVIGARGLAGEEANRTMGLLLANPIKRSTVVTEHAVAMTVYAAVVGAATFAGVTIGSMIAGLDMAIEGIAAASLLVTLLGLVFGALALALSAASGRARIAVYGTVSGALASHLANSFLPLDDSLAGYARWTPHYYYLSSDPLTNGVSWAHATVLAVSTVLLIALAVAAFDHRDLRQH